MMILFCFFLTFKGRKAYDFSFKIVSFNPVSVETSQQTCIFLCSGPHFIQRAVEKGLEKDSTVTMWLYKIFFSSPISFSLT